MLKQFQNKISCRSFIFFNPQWAKVVHKLFYCYFELLLFKKHWSHKLHFQSAQGRGTSLMHCKKKNKNKKSNMFVNMRCDINFCSEQYITIVPFFAKCQKKQWLPSVAHLFSLTHFVTTKQLLYRHKCSSPSGSMVVSFNKSNHDTKLLSVAQQSHWERGEKTSVSETARCSEEHKEGM